MSLLTILAVFLVLFVIGQVLRVIKLSAKLRGRAEDEYDEGQIEEL